MTEKYDFGMMQDQDLDLVFTLAAVIASGEIIPYAAQRWASDLADQVLDCKKERLKVARN